jgi:glycosyltransferase involved in cell wall biosynthesis
VVASNRASIPEVLGDAAILIDPADHTAFAAAALRILTDPQLARDLSARGLARAEAWSPRRQATAAIAAYRALLDRPS